MIKQGVSEYLEVNSQSYKKNSCQIYCTIEGVRHFLGNGTLDEMPEEIQQPFGRSDRIYLLSRIREAAKQGGYYLLKGPLKNTPRTLHLCVNEQGGYLLFTDLGTWANRNVL